MNSQSASQKFRKELNGMGEIIDQVYMIDGFAKYIEIEQMIEELSILEMSLPIFLQKKELHKNQYIYLQLKCRKSIEEMKLSVAIKNEDTMQEFFLKKEIKSLSYDVSIAELYTNHISFNVENN